MAVAAADNTFESMRIVGLAPTKNVLFDLFELIL